jgi:RNA polymerase sigma factor (sigma-70 family)
MQEQRTNHGLEAAIMPDAYLADLTLQGNQDAFATLVHRYQTPLFTYILRFLDDYDLACDSLQNVFIRFHNSLPHLSDNEPYKAWLFAVAHNCCIDELRKRSRSAITFSELQPKGGEYEESVAYDPANGDATPERAIEQQELRHQLECAIASLPPKFRAIVLMRYSTGMTYEEIGRIMQIPTATAKTYFHRGKLLLRKILKAEIRMSYLY